MKKKSKLNSFTKKKMNGDRATSTDLMNNCENIEKKFKLLARSKNENIIVYITLRVSKT